MAPAPRARGVVRGFAYGVDGLSAEPHATRLLLAELLDAGASREWLDWLVGEMRGRLTEWPRHAATPHKWFLWAHGVDAEPDW
jgi:hypothetical protein